MSDAKLRDSRPTVDTQLGVGRVIHGMTERMTDALGASLDTVATGIRAAHPHVAFVEIARVGDGEWLVRLLGLPAKHKAFTRTWSGSAPSLFGAYLKASEAMAAELGKDA